MVLADDAARRDRIQKKKKVLLDLARAHKMARGGAKKVKKLPLSGSENRFTDLVWGSPQGVSGNNCYGYALGVYMDGGYRKLQPGELAGTARDDDDLTKCAVLKRRTLEDLGKDGGYVVGPETACKKGYYKIMSVVDPGTDFHWYRQNGDMLIRADGKKTVANIAANAGISKNSVRAGANKPAECDAVLLENAGLWTHKRGLEELTDKDASGKFIADPRRADRNYGKLRYDKYCNAFCVRNGFGSKHSR